jgi:hypothetical protein
VLCLECCRLRATAPLHDSRILRRHVCTAPRLKWRGSNHRYVALFLWKNIQRTQRRALKGESVLDPRAQGRRNLEYDIRFKSDTQTGSATLRRCVLKRIRCEITPKLICTADWLLEVHVLARELKCAKKNSPKGLVSASEGKTGA